MKKIDMSDKAITGRLRRTDQLRELSLSLMKAKKISDEKSQTETNKTNEKTDHDSLSSNGLGSRKLR